MRLDHLLSKGSEEVRDWKILFSDQERSERISIEKLLRFLAAMRSGDTPVPIPNTTVKTGTADGTMLATAWESRWPPD